MYHPNAMLKLAHDREAELVREAEFCGVPRRADFGSPWLAKGLLAVALSLIGLAVALGWLIG